MMNEEEDKYKQKLHVLASTCEAIQRENEEIASQVVKTKRNLCKARRLRLRLLQKLDEIGDPWRGQVKKGISLKGQRSSHNLNFKVQKVSPGTSSSSSSMNKKSSLSNSTDFGNCSSSMQDYNSLSASTSLSNMAMLPMPESPSFSEHDLMNESISNGM